MFLIFLGGTYLEKGKSLSAMSIWTSTNHNQGESWLVGWQRGVGMEKVWIGEPALEFCIHLYNSIFHYVPLYLRFCAIIFVQLYKCTSANVKTLIYIYTHPIATTTTIIIITSLLYQLSGGQDAKGETKNNFIRNWKQTHQRNKLMTVLLLRTIQISPIAVVCQKIQNFCQLYALLSVKEKCIVSVFLIKLHIVIPSAAKARLSV